MNNLQPHPLHPTRVTLTHFHPEENNLIVKFFDCDIRVFKKDPMLGGKCMLLEINTYPFTWNDIPVCTSLLSGLIVHSSHSPKPARSLL
jgi:hypothetical protein